MQNVDAAATASSVGARLNARSIGKKLLMSVTGVILLLYLVGHLLGNLQIFIGQNQLNAYAAFLHSLGPILWFVRVILLAALVVHVWMAIKLQTENWSARPIGYQKKVYVEAPLSSRTMIWTGIGVFLFVVYHILHLTMFVTNPEYADLHDVYGRHDTYSMVVMGFQNYLISGIYIVSLAIVSYHVVHAARSIFQTWGWNNTRFERLLRAGSLIFAWLLFLGYLSIPAAVLLGWLKLPEGVM